MKSGRRKLPAAPPKSGSHKPNFETNRPENALIATLRQKCQRTRILAAGVDERKVRVAAAASGVEQARRLLGGRAANVGEAVFDAEKIERMLGFAQQGESLRGRLEGDNEIARWLAELEKPQSEASADELQRAAQLLRRWQAADESATLTPVDQTARQRPSLLGAAIAWGLLSVVLAVTVHASWFLGLAASAGLAVWAFWPRRSTDSSDPRPKSPTNFPKSAWRPPRHGRKMPSTSDSANSSANPERRVSSKSARLVGAT